MGARKTACGPGAPAGCREEGILLTRELAAGLNAENSARSATGLRTVGIVLAGSAFVALCAHIVLPLNFTPVPLTLGTFAVLVLGLALSPRLAAATLAAYLTEGALGLPVFSPGLAVGGAAHLLGPTGGYLMAYPAAAALVSWLWRRVRRGPVSGFAGAAAAAAAGSAVMLGGGAVWLAVMTHAAAHTILTLGVIPFLPGEALKVTAAGVTFGYRRLRRRLI